MSELKGQILGVILVLTLFGAISACIKGAFDSYTKKISNDVASIVPTSSGETL